MSNNIIRNLRARGPRTALQRQLLDFYSAPMAIVVGAGLALLLGCAGFTLWVLWTHGSLN